MIARSRKLIKHRAQEELLDACLTAFYRYWDAQHEDKDWDIDEMEKQYRRIEKLFNWTPRILC